MLAGSPFLKDFFLTVSLFPRNSVVESWTVANPYLFLWVVVSSLDRVSFHTHLLENIDLVLPIVHHVHNFSFFWPLRLALTAAAPEAGLSSCLSREETMRLTSCLLQVSDTFFFEKSAVVLRFISDC